MDNDILTMMKAELDKYKNKVAKLEMAIAAFESDDKIDTNYKNRSKGSRQRKRLWRNCDKCGTKYQYSRFDSKYCSMRECKSARYKDTQLNLAIKRGLSPTASKNEIKDAGIKLAKAAKVKPQILLPGDPIKAKEH